MANFTGFSLDHLLEFVFEQGIPLISLTVLGLAFYVWKYVLGKSISSPNPDDPVQAAKREAARRAILPKILAGLGVCFLLAYGSCMAIMSQVHIH